VNEVSTDFSKISFFESRQKTLKIWASAYLVLLLFSHWQLPSRYIWELAAIFSIAMNFTYLIEAISLDRRVKEEACVTCVLIALSAAGIVYSPLFLIAAIIGHGLWDLNKHFGAGIPFKRWYTSSCFVVDMIYGFSLLAFFLNI